MHDAGAVEQDIDAANGGDGGGDRVGIEHVEHARLDIGQALQLSELGLVDVGGDDACALARKGFDRGAADALRGGGDEADLAVETTHGDLLFLLAAS